MATFGSVFNTLLNKDILNRVNAVVLTYIGFLFGALTFLPLMYFELQTWSLKSLTVNGWTGILYGVIFSSAIAYFLFNYSMSKLRAQEVGLFTYIDPIAAVLLAIPLVSEYPNRFFVLGSILVFLGIFLAEKRIPWHPFHKLDR